MSLILPIRVLVVDDEPYLCELSKEFLEQSEDMKVETSDSVSKAMMALEQGHFDVIVSDYQMPVENGIQFLKSLRGDGNQIPFILFTGRGREEVVIEALNNGADSYLQKGGKPESQYVELEHRIRSAVQRFQAEESLRRLNRNLRAISECNRAMIRAKDEQTLFSDICNIICNVAGYRMAWIGMAEQDEAKSVSVSAWSGFEQGYLAQARITWADTERGRGPTGRAIRTGQTVFIQDYRTDASIMPWLATATERGYHSSIAIPLKEEDDVFGALMIYSEQICGFDEEELALLKDMTMDLSFGIISLRDREKRKRAEERLLQTSDRLSLATRAGGVGIWDFDVINNKLTWDGQMFKLYGIKEEQFGGAYEAWKAGLFPEDAERGDEETQMALRGEKEYDTEFRVLWPDGTVHHIRALALVQRDASGRALRMVGTNWDVTENKRAEDLKLGKECSLRNEAEERLRRFPKFSLELEKQAMMHPIHELQVHQVELEMQAQELRVAQVALEETRDKYFDLYENAPLGYITLTDSGLVMEANLTSANLLGIAPARLINSRFSKFIIENDSSVWYQHFLKVLKERDKQTCLLTLKRIDGSIFPAQIESVWVMDASPRAHRVRLTIVDITGIRRAEGALRECEVRFDRMAEHSGTVTWQSDAQGMYTYVSGVSEAVLGYISEELVGKKHFYDLHPESGREEFKGMALELFERRELIHDLVNPVQTKDGRTVWVATNGIPLLDEHGGLLGYQGSDTDITERKRMEDALHESEKRYRLITDNMIEVIVMLDFDLHVTYASPSIEDIFGYTPEETMQKDVADIMTPESLQVVMRAFDEALAMDAPHTNGSRPMLLLELEEYRKDGSTIWVNNSLTYAYNETGEPVAIISVARDITDRRKIERALNEASKKLNLLNSITRHDINNQVLVLTGFLELCKLREKDLPLLEYFDKMKLAANNVQRQIAFTKEYQDIGVKEPSWASPGHQTAGAFAMLHPVRMELEDGTDGVEVLADPLAEKVHYNLIDNSMRHGERVTRIKMSAEQRGEALVIVYEDNGAGIRNEDKKRLFEKGFGKNTGFGLFLCREILAITGITITETGKAGEGVRFEMLVPAGAWRCPSQ